MSDAKLLAHAHEVARRVIDAGTSMEVQRVRELMEVLP